MKGKHFSILREVFSQVVKKVFSTAYFVAEKIYNVSLATSDDELSTVLKTKKLIKKLLLVETIQS